jgi:hypothetical protein
MARSYLYQDGYSLASKDVERRQWIQYVEDLQAKLAAGTPVYVSFKDKRRQGSIGRIISANVVTRSYRSSYGYYGRPGDPTYEIPIIEDLVVGWDDRKNTITPGTWEVFIEPDHTGGTIYTWSQPEKPKVEPKTVHDELGEPVAPGDFVAFVHKRYKNISLCFGTITRITDKGTVFVQKLKVRDGEKSEELRCKDDNLVIVNDALMKRLMMAKLAAN